MLLAGHRLSNNADPCQAGSSSGCVRRYQRRSEDSPQSPARRDQPQCFGQLPLHRRTSRKTGRFPNHAGLLNRLRRRPVGLLSTNHPERTIVSTCGLRPISVTGAPARASRRNRNQELLRLGRPRWAISLHTPLDLVRGWPPAALPSSVQGATAQEPKLSIPQRIESSAHPAALNQRFPNGTASTRPAFPPSCF